MNRARPHQAHINHELITSTLCLIKLKGTPGIYFMSQERSSCDMNYFTVTGSYRAPLKSVFCFMKELLAKLNKLLSKEDIIQYKKAFLVKRRTFLLQEEIYCHKMYFCNLGILSYNKDFPATGNDFL